MEGLSARFLIWLVLAAVVFPGRAQIRVTQNGGADPDSQDGSSWEQALSSANLAEILSSSSRGASAGEFWLGAGVYPRLSLHRGTQIYGGFNETESSRGERDPSRNSTIIQGIYLGEYRVLDENGEVTDIQYPGAGTLIDGCTISTVSLTFPEDALRDGPPLISNCRITGLTGAAAVGVTGGPLQLVDCEIGSGGAAGVVVNSPSGSVELLRCRVTDHLEAGLLVRLGAKAIVTRSIISGNGRAYLDRAPFFRFSGIYIDNASAEIRESEISGNKGNGGGIAVALALPTASGHRVLVADSSITGNSAPGDFSGGGGIWVATYQPAIVDQVVITNSVIAGNFSEWRGGGVYLSGSGSRVYNSTISGNQTAGEGGGIYIFGNPAEMTATYPTVRNSLIVGNSAFEGGGIYLGGTDARILNSTIADNRAEGKGGGIFSYQNRGLTGLAPELQKPAAVANSVIARNTAAEGNALYHTAGLYTGLPANAPLPPLFTSSAIIEGETLLSQPGPTEPARMISLPAGNPIIGDPGFAAPGNYQLRPDSLLIDRGTASHLLSGEVDRAGQPRFSGSAPDIGAYEFIVTGPRILIPEGSAIRGTGGIELRATLQNGGTAPVESIAITSIVARDESEQNYDVTELHLSLAEAGRLGVNESAALRLVLQPGGGTPRRVHLEINGTYVHEGAVNPFQASQIFAITIPTQWLLLENGTLRLEFEGRLQQATSLALPDWRDVDASGTLEIIPRETESYWRALPD